jgi:hypothetical protein
MFGLSVVITVSLVGAVWFRDFQTDLYALLNPEEVQQERFLAQKEGDSLFGVLGKTLGDMGSALNAFWGSDNTGTEAKPGVEIKKQDKVYLLPLSEEK